MDLSISIFDINVVITGTAERDEADSMFFEVFWNVVLFMPYGFLASIISKSKAKWSVLLSGSLLSVAIELTQLITHRGLFEYDDMIHNTLGTVIGIAMFYLAAKVLLSIERRFTASLNTAN